MALLFDVLLGLLIAAAALCAVIARDLLAAIVFFIIYGLLIAVAWVRLDAVDVALAEAAIGAGLTGILLVGASARLKPRREGAAVTRSRWRLTVACLGLAGLAVIAIAALVSVVLVMHQGGAADRPPVAQNLALSGVANPVTAVLLNFRGYDTLLEAVVLAVALIGVWSLTPDRFWGGVPGLAHHARPDGVLAYFGRLLPAIGVLVGVHLLWAGTDAPGGAFQAGTVLAAVWLLIAMAGLTEPPAVSSLRLRLVVVLGPGIFLLFGAVGAVAGAFLRYPPGMAKPVIVTIESLLTVSIAATLCLLVLGVPRRLP